MVPIRYSGPESRNNLRSTTRIAVRVLVVSTLAALAFSLLETPAHPVHASSGSLSLGTFRSANDPISCPGSNWFSYADSGGGVHSMVCFGAVVQNCPNAEDLSLTYGYLSPSGIISGAVKGVVVFFNGGAGTPAAGYDYEGPNIEIDMLTYYFQQGYEVVQLEWSSDWEATQNPFPSPPPYGNIQNAACRPATFLNYVYSNIFQGVLQGKPDAGMCAQGVSAGSAQIVYSMAYYGAGSYLDNVELISGPVFSDIKQGCQEPQPSPATICPAGQWGCPTGQASWTLSPTYLAQSAHVTRWTNDPSPGCAVANNSGSWSRWLAQSIVDQGTGASPTFSYPSTAMSAWLCRSVYNPNNINCATNFNQHYCPNNSSPQGEIFYNNIGSANSPPVYHVYPVDTCAGPEGAPGGTVPALGLDGQTAIEQNMVAHCVHPTH